MSTMIFLKGIFKRMYETNNMDDTSMSDIRDYILGKEKNSEENDYMIDSSSMDSLDYIESENMNKRIDFINIESMESDSMDMYDDKTDNIDIIEEMQSSFIINESIPLYFYDVNTWPDRTSMRCWYCCGRCPGKPWAMPINIMETEDKNNYMEVRGIFCYAPCVLSYIYKINLEHNKDDSITLLKYMYYLFTGKRVNHIPNAVSPYKKQIFIGSNGISEYDYYIMNKKNVERYEDKYIFSLE